MAKRLAETLAAGSTRAELIELPKDRDIRGNSHIMMQDDNNAEIAAMISTWLQRARIR
jgi:alpha-D-ribose 1-methylphosphonate 5-triphosphate synthase subunit PhnG